MSDLPESLRRAHRAATSRVQSGPQNAIRATSPASPYARDRIEAPSNRPAPRTPTLRSQAQDVIRSAPGALSAARERQVYDTTWEDVGRGAQELTGLPSLARGAGGLAALPALARSGFLGADHALPIAGAVAETALGLAGPMSIPRGAARAPAIANFADEPAQRIPNMAREIGPNGMPIAQPQPYRNSLRGGSGDLREAAGMGAPSVASESYPISLLWEGDNIGYNGPWSAWDVTQRPVSSLDIRLAQITGAREVRPHSAAPNTDWTPQDHARRIATLMRERPADPITIRRIGDNEPMRNADGSVDYAPQVIDGKHRLAAARMRGDRSINVQWEQPRTPPPTTPTGTAPFGDPRAYPPSTWEDFGSLQGGTPSPAPLPMDEASGALGRRHDGGNAGGRQRAPRRVVDMRTPRGETHETIVNPTEADILRLTQPGRVAAPGLAIERGVPISSSRGVRYIKDADGNVYVGNSYDVTHHDLVTHYGLPNRGSLDGGEIVRLPDGTLELQNNDGAMPLPRGWLSGRTQLPNAGNSPSLPMDEASRMGRAREQGFDVDTPLYHGTMRDAGREQFARSQGGEIGPGVYVTRDPNLANDFARNSYGGSYQEGAGVIPVFAKRLQQFSGVNENGLMENGWATRRGEIMDRIRAENGGEWSSDIPVKAEMELERLAREQGFAGFYVNGNGGMNQGVVFDPSNIRSIFAAFDPAKRDSSDLLAATNNPGGPSAPGAVPPLSPPSTSDSVAMRMARAERLGFDRRPFYHGTPDARQVRDRGGFERRTQNAGYLTDPDRYAAIQSEMAAERAANGTSARYFELLNEAGSLNQHVEAPRPIYLSDNEGIARSYARDDRAFDYQGAEPAVMPLHTRGNLMVVDGGGERFANMSIDRVRASLPESRRADFDAMVARYKADFTGNPGRITTNDLEAIAHGMGFDGFEVRNVRDTYQGQGAPSTVRAIFDPSHLRSPGAAFDPAKRDSSDLLAGLTAAAPIPIAASALTQQQNTTGRSNRRPGLFGGR